MSLNRIPAYTEIVRHGENDPAIAAVTAVQADRIVATAIRRGYLLEPSTQGVLVLRRPAGRVVVELRPVTRPRLTEGQAREVALLADRGGGLLRLRPEGLVITSGIARVPPASARRLLGRGWVSCATFGDGERVSVSVAGRVALALCRHTTRTSRPRGWHLAADHPSGPQVVGRDRHGGRLYDGTSTAVCSCGWSQFADRRPAAAHAARQHRIDNVTAALTT